MSLIRADSLCIGTANFEIDGLEVKYTGHVHANDKAFGWGTAIDEDGGTWSGTFRDNTGHGVGKSSFQRYSIHTFLCSSQIFK